MVGKTSCRYTRIRDGLPRSKWHVEQASREKLVAPSFTSVCSRVFMVESFYVYVQSRWHRRSNAIVPVALHTTVTNDGA